MGTHLTPLDLSSAVHASVYNGSRSWIRWLALRHEFLDNAGCDGQPPRSTRFPCLINVSISRIGSTVPWGSTTIAEPARMP